MPDAEVPRSDVVAVRIARKLGPLFGVVWEQNPFGCTWVSDFATITLAEIARGAPYPTRDIQSSMDGQATQEDPALGPRPAPGDMGEAWQPAGRAVWTFRRAPTRAAIAHATLNRYGPDTKAAVVLVGTNRLLQDVTAAVASVCQHLDKCDASLEVRLAVWAGLVLEAFRGQPALVAAAIQARAIQRALTTPWGEHLWLPGLHGSARCEFGAVGRETGSPAQSVHDTLTPTQFALVDATLPLLGLPLPVDEGPLLSHRELLDDIASRWCRRLLQIGHPGRGITWVSERVPGHRSVQSYVRVGSAIAPFVAEVFSMLGIADRPGRTIDTRQLTRLLTGTDYEQLAGPARRAHLVSAHTLVNYLRFHDNLLRAQPGVRAETRAFIQCAAAQAAERLSPDDPTALLLASYAAYCTAWDLSRDTTADASLRSAAAAHLARALNRVSQAWLSGSLDPGTASYLLEIGAMALDAMDQSAGDADLSGLWQDAMRARGVDPDRVLDGSLSLPDAQCYHLQNYAAFLASRATGPAALRRALTAQRACVRVRDLVTQGELADYEAKFTSARTSRQAAAAIVGRLLEVTSPAESTDYRNLLAEGVAHARAAIVNPTTRPMLGHDQAAFDVVRLALAVLPALTAAREWERHAPSDDPLVDEALRDGAEELLSAATSAAALLGNSLSAKDRKALDDVARRQSGRWAETATAATRDMAE
jgi:hypothetical protein